MSELVVTRTFVEPPDRVWHAITDPEALAAWFWPPSFATRAVSELRPSGAFRIESAPMDMAVGGEFLEIEPTRRLSHTWKWDGDEHESVVAYALSAWLNGTTLVLTHTGLVDDTDRDNHIQGWNDCFDRLPAYLA